MLKKIKEQTTVFQKTLLSTIILIAALTAAPVHAVITFNFQYTDAMGVGFNAAAPLGDARRLSLEQTGVLFSNLYPTLTANIVLAVNGSETEDSTLAAAGSNFTSPLAGFCPPQTPGFVGRGDVGIKLLGGTDPSPEMADGTVTVNFEDFMWDLDDSIDPTMFDFKSTMLHELLHAAGFSHSISNTGTDPCGQATTTPGIWAPFDQHLGNATQTFINNTTFIIDPAAYISALTGGTGNSGLLWRGANGIAGNAGQAIPIFSPNPIQSGSTGSHLDDDFFTDQALLMEAATGQGQGTRTLSPLELGMLVDIGFPSSAAGPGPGPDPAPGPAPGPAAPDNCDFFIINRAAVCL